MKTLSIKHYALSIIPAAFLGLAACDDGEIYTNTIHSTEGRSITLTADINGADRWTDDYKLAVAGFGSDEEYADITKYISNNGNVSIKLSGIGSSVTEVRLCVIDRLRRHVLTFASMNIENVRDSAMMELGYLDVSMYDAIQQEVFDMSCTNCHGAATTAAAGLFLTKDKSYEALLNKPSIRLPQNNLVTPGDPYGSVLHMVISTDSTETWHYDHSKDIMSKDIKLMIDNWILNGAKR